MSYDDDDFAISDDEEEMSPGTLDKEGSSSDVAKTVTSHSEIEVPPSPTKGNTESIGSAPPGSIESVINLVNNSTSNPVQNKSSTNSSSNKQEAVPLNQSVSRSSSMKKDNVPLKKSISKSNSLRQDDVPLKRSISKSNSVRQDNVKLKKSVSKGSSVNDDMPLKKGISKQDSSLKQENVSVSKSLSKSSSSKDDMPLKKEISKQDSSLKQGKAPISKSLSKSSSIKEDVQLKKSLSKKDASLKQDDAYTKRTLSKKSSSRRQEDGLSATASQQPNTKSDNENNDDDEYDMANDFEEESIAPQHDLSVSFEDDFEPEDTSDVQAKPLNTDLDMSASPSKIRKSSSKPVMQAESGQGPEVVRSKSASGLAAVNDKTSQVAVASKAAPLKSSLPVTSGDSKSSIVKSDCGDSNNASGNSNRDEYYDDNGFEDEECGEGDDVDHATAKGKSQDIASSVIATPQKSRPHKTNEGAEESTSPHRNGKHKKHKGEIDYANKISELDKKIRAIAAEREKFSPIKIPKKKNLPKLKKKKCLPPPKMKPPKKYNHSKLKFIMADVSISPYMTSPNVQYSQETLRLPEIIRNLKYDKSGQQLPFDEKQMKDKFINEVYNFKKNDNLKRKE